MREPLIIKQKPLDWYAMALKHLVSSERYGIDSEYDLGYRCFWTYNAVENTLLGLGAEAGLPAIIENDAGDIGDLLDKAIKALHIDLQELRLPAALMDNIDVVRSWRYANEPLAAFPEVSKPILDEAIRQDLSEQLDVWLRDRIANTI